MTRRAAVIGAGPSGFYATDQLLRAGFEVDLYDALPTPFGLVRAGVAPDHPKIKAVTRVFEKTAQHPGFCFFGGVQLGSDISRADLLGRYHAVVYAVGTTSDRRLGIPGEDLPGSVAATEFVAWYNGHPSFADHKFDLSCERAVVVGNGNVALDVARMLLLDPDDLRHTDTAEHALSRFGAARVSEVIMLGRRGPAQAAFTNPELRELGELTRARVIVSPEDLTTIDTLNDLSPTAKRNVEILQGYAQRRPHGKSHQLDLRFLRSPVEIRGTDRVTGLWVAKNRLDADGHGGRKAAATGEHELIECGLVLRSIGYRGVPLVGVPFDESRGVIANEAGRVTDESGRRLPGEYTVGWIKRGASGVIGTNKKDAAETTAKILEDADAGRLNEPTGESSASEATAWLRLQVPAAVSWSGWQLIDRHELAAGKLHGRPRLKVVRVSDMCAIAGPYRSL